MRKILATSVIAMLFSSSAFSKTSIPIFDVNNGCAKWAAAFDSVLWMQGRCIETEHRAYDRLENEWELTNETVRKECVIHPNDDDKQTYRGLSSCLSRKENDDESKSKIFHQ